MQGEAVEGLHPVAGQAGQAVQAAGAQAAGQILELSIQVVVAVVVIRVESLAAEEVQAAQVS
jgi:hypothetical protein